MECNTTCFFFAFHRKNGCLSCTVSRWLLSTVALFNPTQIRYPVGGDPIGISERSFDSRKLRVPGLPRDAVCIMIRLVFLTCQTETDRTMADTTLASDSLTTYGNVQIYF